jgi:mono/diheme cytochrome c family protein
MQSNTNRLKLLAVAFVALLAVLALVSASPATPRAAADNKPFDAAASYKGKCSACHGKQAEKKFDATKTDDALAEVVLKGKADAKPKMPAYETKGVTLDQAKALVAHMRSLHP